jgi:hypothetical protein
MKRQRISLASMYVGQFHLSATKLERALDAFDPDSFGPLCVREVDDKRT